MKYFYGVFLFLFSMSSWMYAITATRISEINQFIADLKNNKVIVESIESRVQALKRGLSYRERNFDIIKKLDEAVADTLNAYKAKDVEVAVSESEPEVLIDEPVRIMVPQDLVDDIQAFVDKIRVAYEKNNAMTVEQQQAIKTDYKTVQERLLKYRNADNFRINQDKLNDATIQFAEIEKRKTFMND